MKFQPETRVVFVDDLTERILDTGTVIEAAGVKDEDGNDIGLITYTVQFDNGSIEDGILGSELRLATTDAINESIKNGDVAPFADGISNEERERLACLAEEAGEIVQCVGKILRHGWESFNPFDVKKTTNRRNLAKECNDLGIIFSYMVSKGDFPNIEEHVVEDSDNKLANMKKYLHYNKI